MRGSDNARSAYTIGQLSIRDILREMGYSPDLEVPFGKYACDIFLVGMHVCIEYDGSGHWKKRDAKRDAYLMENFQLPTLRLKYYTPKDKVIAAVEEFIAKWKDSAHSRREILWMK